MIVLDIATFLVPPLLPAITTSINAYAQKRLRAKGIFCLDSNFINFAGSADIVCFDKTGTLTEDNMDIANILPSQDAKFLKPESNIQNINQNLDMITTIGTCHSLQNNRHDGDKLEMRMFEALDWEFKSDTSVNSCEEFEGKPERIIGPKNSNRMFGLIRLFPFEPVLQRMTVVVKEACKKDYLVLMKGAPEIVKSFCEPKTVPSDFDQVLSSYTVYGLRVISTASKPISMNLATIQRLDRENLESNLTFTGFIVFHNKLKPQTISTLSILKDVNIRIIMATGDNMMTGVSVAKTSGMIEEADSLLQVHVKQTLPNDSFKLETNFKYLKTYGFSDTFNSNEIEIKNNEKRILIQSPKSKTHLCIEGKCFELIRNKDTDLLKTIIKRGTIFARMTPDQKQHLIEDLQKFNWRVGMCGDGANDCGALRRANFGISLSLNESSVACPFTYRDKNIECIPTLIREGRACLASTLGAFKYQVAYCFVMLSVVLILFWEGLKISDGGFVFIDILLNIFPLLVFGTTKAYPKLVKKKLSDTTFSRFTFFSIFSFVCIQNVVYLITRQILIHKYW